MQVHSYDSYVEVTLPHLCFSGSQQILTYGSGIDLICKMEKNSLVVNSRVYSFSPKLLRKQFIRFIAVLIMFDLGVIL